MIRKTMIHKSKKGFSILEVVFAIYIISMGLLGLVSLVRQTFIVKYLNKNNLIASMLAQEGLEIVRNKRDFNWMTGQPFDTGLATSTYAVDLENISTVAGINDPGAQLKFNSGGFYCIGDWTEYACDNSNVSSFYRVVNIVDHGNYLSVECQVRYRRSNNQYDYMASEELYDWQ